MAGGKSKRVLHPLDRYRTGVFERRIGHRSNVKTSCISLRAFGIHRKAFFSLPACLLLSGVDRSRKTSLVDQMVHNFAKYKNFNLDITPEGTRKANPNWKKGFYFIALKAKVPVSYTHLPSTL